MNTNTDTTVAQARDLKLQDIPKAIHGRKLRPGNAVVYNALCLALAATFELDDAGTGILDVELRGSTAVLRIDQPPVFVQGSRTVRKSEGAYTVSVYAAPFKGVQLEWHSRCVREICSEVANGA